MNTIAEILHNLHASLKLPSCHTLRNETLITPGVEESLSSHFKIVSTSNLASIAIILLLSSFRLVFLAVALILARKIKSPVPREGPRFPRRESANTRCQGRNGNFMSGTSRLLVVDVHETWPCFAPQAYHYPFLSLYIEVTLNSERRG
jgi:hypothetical protein